MTFRTARFFHPFYEAWQAGTLTREQLATYARIYHGHVDAFPTYLRTALAGTVDPLARRVLSDNLHDELTNPASHVELWRDFADALGVDRDALAQAAPHPAGVSTIQRFERLAAASTVRALAALYAYESQQPAVSTTKLDGLTTHYGVRSPRALAYFQVHATIDRDHRQAERDALRHCLETGDDADDVSEAAGEALDAYWGLLDGVCAACE